MTNRSRQQVTPGLVDTMARCGDAFVLGSPHAETEAPTQR
eukprot:CAMPEP_0170201460 /NCGR_PEP_ID=MMETSP0116_2-20130129/183_1 /TAXON_ID=400756 /ORGANISM="Durinskia baltica, Strain CSIRO CS-38" /LENGTH=39 /DNA_ID= /DNA_START= /DNA_END= /DNA_ORIENTATION=